MSWWILGALGAASIAVRWFTRCRHPNPHFIRAVIELNRATGESAVIQPARYYCYECGKTWPAISHDQAWMPTRLVQKFVGYDQTKMVRAATRAAIEQEQRRFLAVNRAGSVVPPTHDLKTSAPRRRKRPGNVVDLNSRRPA